jgi:D-cysteine desulfhydrase
MFRAGSPPFVLPLEVTPIEAFPGLPLWIKRDDRVHPRYGGNKPRKLARLLVQASKEGARRLLTFGAAGSHHALATALFGREAGFQVSAILLPQRRTDHAAQVLRAALGQGLDARPLAHARHLPAVLAAFPGAWVLPAGGSSVEGALAFVDAAAELRAAVDRGELPAPCEVVVATGSGGTAAGLAVGLLREGLPTRVVCAAVARPAALVHASVAALTARVARHLRLPPREALARLVLDASAAGEGYGLPSDQGAEAAVLAAAHGLPLDPTYTQKAFALALRRAHHREVLYWHTLSSAPLEPLLASAPDEGAIDPALRELLVTGASKP